MDEEWLSYRAKLPVAESSTPFHNASISTDALILAWWNIISASIRTQNSEWLNKLLVSRSVLWTACSNYSHFLISEAMASAISTFVETVESRSSAEYQSQLVALNVYWTKRRRGEYIVKGYIYARYFHGSILQQSDLTYLIYVAHFKINVLKCCLQFLCLT
jgi:hypothetical protein